MTVSRKDQSPLKLNILGAVYGLCNVTSAAQSFVTANQEFDKAAYNAVWRDGWPGHKKTLVVVYEYSDISMLEIAVEGDQMHFIASPPLTILGAAYGLKNVTEILTKLLKNSAILMPGSAHVLSISAREEHARLLETRGCDTRVRYLKGFIF